MPSVKDNPDSRFLHSGDLINDDKWQEYALTIAKVIPAGELKYENGDLADHEVLCFKETNKMFGLSAKCNRMVMPFATGSQSREKWVGKKITIYPALLPVCFDERDVAVVRIRPSPGARPKLNRKHVGKDITGTKVQTLQEDVSQ